MEGFMVRDRTLSPYRSISSSAKQQCI